MTDLPSKCYSRLGHCEKDADIHVKVRSYHMGSSGHVTKWAAHSDHFYQDDRIGATESKTTITEIDASAVPEPVASITKSATQK